MRKTRIIAFLWVLWLVLPMPAQEAVETQVMNYAEKYSGTKDADKRIRLANEFFAFLQQTDYLEELVVFPADAHIDSVDVNVYYYIAEWNYGEGKYSRTTEYCLRAAQACTEHVDENSKGDVYSLLGAAYFRLGEFDKAADALHVCYEIDSKSGDYDQLSSTLNNIAGIFVAAGKPQEAEKYILEAIAANSLTQNKARRAVLFGTASEMYHAMGDEKQSLTYARRALDIERQRGDSAKIGVRLSQVANAELGLSHTEEAQRALEEAMPLLEAAGNKHSLGICMNQMGDIHAAQNKDEEALEYYREAAALFFTQEDMYNEAHAREGMYRMLKQTAPDEAMLHLERAKQLRDSVYQKQTSETISRYNAIYHNDLLQKEAEESERHRQVILFIVCALLAFLVLLGISAWTTYLKSERTKQDYEQNIHTLQNQFNEINRLYQNSSFEWIKNKDGLTEDDHAYIEKLTQIIDEEVEKGNLDLKSVTDRLHTTEQTLRRRLYKMLGLTPMDFFTRVRMEKAKYLLLNFRDMTIADVSEKCGYTMVTNFSRAFTRFYNVNPSEVKSKNQQPIERQHNKRRRKRLNDDQ
ncbi:MAG: tetratricopeptide repeat protein [Paludibacteraceae bacterium]|nr:tetratricopeptide repeat protein [Paludibacteraceae bacterium]